MLPQRGLVMFFGLGIKNPLARIDVFAASNHRSGAGPLTRSARNRSIPRLDLLEERRLLSTLTVTNLLDDGSSGSLRWAITQADKTGGSETIQFDPTVFASPQTITLNSALPDLDDISGTETIAGPAAGLTIARAASNPNQFRILTIDSGADVALSKLTITGGNISGNGAGLFNSGIVSLSDCTVSGNSAPVGGGQGIGYGGGIFNQGTASLFDCTVSGNSTSSVATLNAGGGIANFATAILVDCTVSGNSAFARGGGIENAATLLLTNCTVSGNTTFLYGGGIYGVSGNINLTACTVSGNSAADGAGGGVYTKGNITLTDTILAGNASQSDPDLHGPLGPASKNNLIGGNPLLSCARRLRRADTDPGASSR